MDSLGVIIKLLEFWRSWTLAWLSDHFAAFCCGGSESLFVRETSSNLSFGLILGSGILCWSSSGLINEFCWGAHISFVWQVDDLCCEVQRSPCCTGGSEDVSWGGEFTIMPDSSSDRWWQTNGRRKLIPIINHWQIYQEISTITECCSVNPLDCFQWAFPINILHQYIDSQINN